MPHKAPRVCLEPGCPNLSTATRCPEHTRARQRQQQTIYRNPAKQKVYHSKRWAGVRRTVLRESPWCECGAPAQEVDHIEDFTDWYDPRTWDYSNLRSLCKPCHTRKTFHGE